jgi:hypothetical protein
MHQPVDQGGSQADVLDDAGPLREALVEVMIVGRRSWRPAMIS